MSLASLKARHAKRDITRKAFVKRSSRPWLPWPHKRNLFIRSISFPLAWLTAKSTYLPIKGSREAEIALESARAAWRQSNGERVDRS